MVGIAKVNIPHAKELLCRSSFVRRQDDFEKADELTETNEAGRYIMVNIVMVVIVRPSFWDFSAFL